MSKIYLATTLAGILLVLWGCGTKDDIHETDHPGHGTITLTTDWTNRTTGIDLPASYTVKSGDYSATLTGATHTLAHLFAPGSHTLYIYNTPDNITVSGTTAKATGTSAPGWLFTRALDVAVTADANHAFTAGMEQQVRQLTLEIGLTGGTADRVAGITAVLSGVAGSYDIAGGTHGDASQAMLTFAKDTGGKWKTTVRLLGVTGAAQKLTGIITFTGGSPADTPLESDLTTALAAFNADKKTPLTLDSSTEAPTGTGFTATITGWKAVAGGSGTAN